MNSTKYYWLRWIGVLPASIIAYLIAYNLLNLLALFNKYFYGMSNDGWYALYIVPVIASGMAGYAFIFFGAFMAPYYKKYVGITLLILLALLTGGAILIEIGHPRIMGVIELTTSMIGALISYFGIEDLND